MADEERIRIEIGFKGGQTLLAAVPTGEADELQRQLQARSDAVVELQCEDGLYLVALRHVAFVKRFTRDSRVGFGHR